MTGRQRSVNGEERRKVWGTEGCCRRGPGASQGSSNTPGPCTTQGRASQGSWDPAVSGKSEGQLAPHPPPQLPPPLGSIGCATFQAFQTSLDTHLCVFSGIVPGS